MNNSAIRISKLPDLVIGQTDHSRLTALANAVTGPMEGAAERLASELDRATIVDQRNVPSDVVTMGSVASFTTTDGFNRTFELVYPGESDISAGKVSILTPVGMALIGMREGQSIPWTARDGRELSLALMRVRSQPAPS
ncbi:nucleoside diphosphate kinase regulator [Pelagibacterium montanilacus]|uniref:nucleoside diphosphate kinase regulator n=1 Tax=Pelagibacterium montanilacus TaxID=2185280 RepID=UPI000F8C79CB|nr:nucleoside diphosphate kinase regulator [Pelagibacterium montanilacus]